MNASTSSGEKVAERLSPPLSIRMISQVGMTRLQLVHGRHVHAGVVADRGVRAAAGLDAEHAVGGQRLLRTRNSASSRV